MRGPLPLILVTLLSCAGPSDGYDGPPCQAPCSDDTDCVGGRSCVKSACAGQAAPVDTQVHFPSTDGVLHVPFTLDAHGGGGQRLSAFAVRENLGLAEVDGIVIPVVVHARTTDVWGTTFQLVGVGGGRLAAIRVRCSNGFVTDVSLQSTVESELAHEAADGECIFNEAEVDVPVRFDPARIDVESPVDNYVIEGRDVALTGASGAIRVHDRELGLVSWTEVDCTTSCGPPGWRELHAFLVDNESREVCFSELRLYGSQSDVHVSSALCFPSLTRIVDEKVCGDWRRY